LEKQLLEIDPIINNQSQRKGWQPFSGEVKNGHIIFPSNGQYIILSELGVKKILIMSDLTLEEEIFAIAGFISRNIIHSGFDVKSCTFAKEVSSVIYYPNLYKKLFQSDQPLGLICGQAALLGCSLFHHLNFLVRHVWIYCSSNHNGHMCMEVFSEKTGEWYFFDPDFGCMLKDSSGNFLSTDEIIHRCKIGEADYIHTIDLAGKSIPLKEFQYLFSFEGDLNWAPSMMQKNPSVPPNYCKDILVKNRFDSFIITEVETSDLGLTRKLE
jgi:hypothetical protein